MQPDGHSFRVLTYNILARSLGSNTIPWVLNVSPQTRTRIEDKTGEAFGTWRRTNVDEEYKRHWHKGQSVSLKVSNGNSSCGFHWFSRFKFASWTRDWTWLGLAVRH